MSVVGIDFGNDSCFVAVARAGGIETIDNDYSLRATPSFVAFGERQRIIGVAAKNQAVTNLKNTVFNFKRYLGRQFDDPSIQEDLRKAPFRITQAFNCRAGIQVKHCGEEQVYTPEQITAMLFTKLKETTETAIHAKVHDCVISVPSYFTDAERRALLTAAHIAGLNVLRLLNETAAAALNYGIYKQDLPDPDMKPRNVVIVDCGHSALQVAIIAFQKGKLKVLAEASDPSLGGRNFDAILADYFCAEFRSRYHIDAQSNPRAYMRLLTEVEKLKKQMSANATKLPLSIECFMDEKDVASSMCRADFEQMCASLFHRIENVLQKCLHDSKLNVEELYSVEMIGGSTRIPAIKNLIEKVFRKPPSTTLNQEESVARGCALQCAILSPAFKVRDFSITDIQPYPISLVWDENLGEDGCSEVFTQFHPIPFTRQLTFYRKGGMNLKAVYGGHVPYTTNVIGKFAVNFKNDDMEPLKVKLKARVDMNGVFHICGATVYEKVEQISQCSQESVEGEPMVLAPPEAEAGASAPQSQESVVSMDESDSNASVAASDENVENPVKKTVQFKGREIEVKGMACGFGVSAEELDEMITSEAILISRDRSEKERLDSRNALEEYVYDLRGKLDTELMPFVEDRERQDLSQTLSALEDWLYEEGSDKKKDVYIEKLRELKLRSEPIKERRSESEERPGAFHKLEVALQLTRKFLDMHSSKDPRYDHIAPSEIEKVIVAIQESECWLQNSRQKFLNYQPYMPLPVKVKEILEHRRNFEKKVTPIINSPKPKLEPPNPKEEQARAHENQNENSKSANDSTNANGQGQGQSDSQNAEMEVE